MGEQKMDEKDPPNVEKQWTLNQGLSGSNIKTETTKTVVHK